MSAIRDVPSTSYRRQIKNLAARMRELTTQTVLQPLRSMTAFHKAEKDFKTAQEQADLCCSVMDTASVENQSRANNATTAVMREMLHIKNNASDMIESEPNETLENRQHKKAD